MTSPKAYYLTDWTGYLDRSEVDFLMELARSLPDNPVVINIGAGHGTSGISFMDARGDLTLYTIDVNDYPNPYGGLVNERNAFEICGFIGQARHHQIHGKSQDVGKSWTGGKVDMVFVDGDHSLPAITGDVENWLPHVKPGGIMVFHDYRTPWIQATVESVFLPECEIGEAGNMKAFRVMCTELEE